MKRPWRQQVELALGDVALATTWRAERLRELHEYLAGDLANPRLHVLLSDLGQGDDWLKQCLARAAQVLRGPSAPRARHGLPASEAAGIAQAEPLVAVLQQALQWPLAHFCEPPIRWALDVEAGLVSPGSPHAWAQVLSGLVSNSALHGFAGRPAGQIGIAARRRGTKVLRVTYQDNGVGFSPVARENAFRRRFSSRAALGSSGLGLCLLRDVVQVQLNGAIALLDSPAGAVFVIDVPAHGAPCAA